jgi:hypothetical protein
MNDIVWNHRNYVRWFTSRQLSFKWMLWVILLFPFFAATWEMKQIVGISPLQILGLFVFVISFVSGLLLKSTSKGFPLILKLFLFILLINLLFLNLYEVNFGLFTDGIRTLLPFTLLFYFRKSINSIYDFEGFLITFVIACIFPLCTLFYEITFDPIRTVYNTASRGGGLRLSGFYANLFGYMGHLICSFIIYCYFYLKNLDNKQKHYSYSTLGFTVVLALTLTGIHNLRHQASWAVILILLSLFIYMSTKKTTFFKAIMFIFILIYVITFFYTEIFQILYAKDINVFSGDAQTTAALNGRVWIWDKYFTFWDDFGGTSKLFGVGLEQHPASKIMMSGGMHSDYVRFLFSTGIIGVFLYISFLVLNLINGMNKSLVRLKFIQIASVVTIILYGISSLPLLASGSLMYFVLAVIAQNNKRIL